MDSSFQQWHQAVQSSELLYLIVANSNYGGTPALEYFRPSDIGDPDGDGLLEFVDAWGNPIRWIRWPAGYPSDLNRYAGTDAMDPLRTDWRYSAWPEPVQPQTIVPLIVSAGPDEQFGIRFEFGYIDSNNQSIEKPVVYAHMTQGYGISDRFYVDPFFTWDGINHKHNGDESAPPLIAELPTFPIGYRANQLGSVISDLATDNITNHDIILGP